MYRYLAVLLTAVIMLNSCSKSDDDTNAVNDLKGTWRREGTDGNGPGNTLYFAIVNNVPTLTFDCSGSPGPNWPILAQTPYKFVNQKLSYLDYSDNSQGYYNVTSFRWITKGEEFEIEFRQILLYMSAIYTVKYKKID